MKELYENIKLTPAQFAIKKGWVTDISLLSPLMIDRAIKWQMQSEKDLYELIKIEKGRGDK